MMKRFLLVDDDPVFNFLNTKTLQKIGVAEEIHTALNGQEALDLFSNYYKGVVSAPDIILLDLNMPIMDGFAFLEAYKKISFLKKENTRIIVVSSSLDPRDIKRAKDLGATAYISKPVTEQSLRMALDS